MCNLPVISGGVGNFEDGLPFLHSEEGDDVVGKVPVPTPMEGPPVIGERRMVYDDTRCLRLMAPNRNIGG